jgi:cell division protein FtsW (lipid II flippase)
MATPVLWTQMSREQRSRVTAMFSATSTQRVPADDRFQIHRAEQLRALGRYWGSCLAGVPGPAARSPKLPEAHTDMILSIVGERFGVAGCVAIALAYLLLCWRSLAVASATRDPFARLVVVGIVALVMTEALVNAAMSVGLAPVTGLTLPLVSYGGSSMLMHALAVGVVINVGLRPGYDLGSEPFVRAAA